MGAKCKNVFIVESNINEKMSAQIHILNFMILQLTNITPIISLEYRRDLVRNKLRSVHPPPLKMPQDRIESTRETIN